MVFLIFFAHQLMLTHLSDAQFFLYEISVSLTFPNEMGRFPLNANFDLFNSSRLLRAPNPIGKNRLTRGRFHPAKEFIPTVIGGAKYTIIFGDVFSTYQHYTQLFHFLLNF